MVLGLLALALAWLERREKGSVHDGLGRDGVSDGLAHLATVLVESKSMSNQVAEWGLGVHSLSRCELMGDISQEAGLEPPTVLICAFEVDIRRVTAAFQGYIDLRPTGATVKPNIHGVCAASVSHRVIA